MGKCKKCNVTVRDYTDRCPLCQCVVEKGEERTAGYPNIRLKETKRAVFSHIFLFSMLVISLVLIAINFGLDHQLIWCPIPIAALAYLYLVIRYGFMADAGYRAKMLVLILCGLLLCVLIDFNTGFYKWSVNYVVPIVFLIVDVAIVVLMIVNRKNWPSYIMFQLAMVMFCIILIVLWQTEIITAPLLSMITVGVNVLLILGTVIIGDRKAKTEIKRRFHIR